jgi:2-oxoglutarate dehydrogenase E2 component (dihydrolipoamide succinyltransferase)
MATEIRVPALGESVTEAIVGKWYKKAGDAVAADGTLAEQLVKEGDTVAVGAVLGSIGGQGAVLAQPDKAAGEKISQVQPNGSKTPQAEQGSPNPALKAGAAPKTTASDVLSPAVRKGIVENNLDPSQIAGTGKDSRILKGDVIAAAEAGATAFRAPTVPAPAPVQAPRVPSRQQDLAREERVRMTKLRQTIARRLKESQNTAAMLTTFNEVDMTQIMAARVQYKDLFEKKHKVKLGFMGFFVKACIQALHEIPAVNAEIDGEDLVYKNYYNIGIAVGTDRGLVVPVVRDADRMGIAEVEKTIAELGRRARDGKLGIDEMQGGTFTITNGGIYGSLMSTPILNAPQSGILGMHKIQDRPVVIDGKVEVRPMMYLALSYDHRIVDGREAVTFLVRVKESLEDPQRLVLDL